MNTHLNDDLPDLTNRYRSRIIAFAQRLLISDVIGLSLDTSVNAGPFPTAAVS